MRKATLLCALLLGLLAGCATPAPRFATTADFASPGKRMLRVGFGRLRLTPPAAQEVVNCATSTACTSTGPSATATGDQIWLAFGKLNEDNQKLFDIFGASSNFATTGTALYSDVLSLWTGTKDAAHCGAGDGTMQPCSGSGTGIGSFSLSGTCTHSGTPTGSATGGIATMSSAGGCTIIVTPSYSATHFWNGHMGDRTQPTVPAWVETSSSSTTVTFTVPAAVSSGDVVTFGLEAQ